MNVQSNRTVPYDECASCGQKGHWQNDSVCPNYGNRASRQTEVAQNNENQNTAETAVETSIKQTNCTRISMLSVSNSDTTVTSEKGNKVISRDIAVQQPSKARVYLTVSFQGKVTSALIDTGATHSVVGHVLVNDAEIQTTTLRLHAASGVTIKVLGCVQTKVVIGDESIPVTLLVTDELNELVLGLDWLRANKCDWHFKTNTVTIRNRRYPLGYSNGDNEKEEQVEIIKVKGTATQPNKVKGYIPGIHYEARPWKSQAEIDAAFEDNLRIFEGILERSGLLKTAEKNVPPDDNHWLLHESPFCCSDRVDEGLEIPSQEFQSKNNRASERLVSTLDAQTVSDSQGLSKGVVASSTETVITKKFGNIEPKAQISQMTSKAETDVQQDMQEQLPNFDDEQLSMGIVQHEVTTTMSRMIFKMNSRTRKLN